MEYFEIDDEMLAFEHTKWKKGLKYVAGVDEAGRGPLAGPVVVAAVIFTDPEKIPIVNDSKKLSAKKRNAMRQMILETPGVLYAIKEISPVTIDEKNILQATHLGMRTVISSFPDLDFVFIDGLPVPDFPVSCESIVKGDSKSASIAAASILAKTHRDAIMDKYDEEFPEYGFKNNSGYGTAEHMAALKKYGATPIHRKSFAPVRDVITPPPEQLELF